MGSHYQHLQVEHRIKLYELLYTGIPIAAIAKELGYHRATLYRELERNSCGRGYRPDWACQQAFIRHHRRLKLDLKPELRSYVIDKLKQGWSPELIAGRLKNEGSKIFVCCETIYHYIYSPSGKAQKLYQFLGKQRRFRYPRNKRKRQVVQKQPKPSIHTRDNSINQREDFGHWEGDLILFKQTKINLITLRERKSRYIKAIINGSRKAHTTTDTLVHYRKQKLNGSMQSLTLDNDPAFADYQAISRSLKASIYFCEPYKSYQKGSIENGNRLLRTQLPKETAIDLFSQDDIDRITDQFNNRPMKCLQFKTPKEVFLQGSTKGKYFLECRT